MLEVENQNSACVVSTEKKKIDVKKWLTEYLPLVCTGILLITFGIIYKQAFIKLLPTLVSLFVMLLNSRVNRFGLLLGGINAVIYSIGYFMEKLYPSAVSAIAISGTMGIVGFVLWSKNQTTDKQVKVRKLTLKSGGLFLAGAIVAWIAFFFVYRALGTKSLVLDNTLFILALVITTMQMLRYMEMPYLNIISLLVSIVQWTILTVENTANITYLIYNIFSLYCVVKSIFVWIKLYREQNNQKCGEEVCQAVENC